MNRDEIQEEAAERYLYGREDASVRQWERKAIAGLLALLVTVFGVWAGVVWSGTDKVVTRIDRLGEQMSADRLEQAQYRMIMERRLTIQEQQLESIRQRQDWVIKHIQTETSGGVP